MKIAIANDGGFVSSHFGHCHEFLLLSVENGEATARQTLPTPAHEPCSLPGYLSDQGVTCVIAGGMGVKAQQNFKAYGIDTLLGVQGAMPDIVESLLEGSLKGGASSCSHSGHGCEAHEG